MTVGEGKDLTLLFVNKSRLSCVNSILAHVRVSVLPCLPSYTTLRPWVCIKHCISHFPRTWCTPVLLCVCVLMSRIRFTCFPLLTFIQSQIWNPGHTKASFAKVLTCHKLLYGRCKNEKKWFQDLLTCKKGTNTKNWNSSVQVNKFVLSSLVSILWFQLVSGEHGTNKHMSQMLEDIIGSTCMQSCYSTELLLYHRLHLRLQNYTYICWIAVNVGNILKDSSFVDKLAMFGWITVFCRLSS